eukprot:6057475-Pyramimonas_sp.AAC.1
MSSWGGPHLRSALVLSLASRTRAAPCTLPEWRLCYDKLSEAEVYFSLQDILERRRSPNFWEEPPIV